MIVAKPIPTATIRSYLSFPTITFDLPQQGESVTLTAGDWLDLPAGVVHGAVVGDIGVVCPEGHQSRSIFIADGPDLVGQRRSSLLSLSH